MSTAEATTRVHDQAVYDWLNGLKIDYGNVAGTARPNHPILRRFASPSRAFAAIVDLLVQQGWIDGADAAEKRKNASDFSVLPLPVCTIERTGPNPDTQLSRVPIKFRRFYLNPTTGQYEILRHPGHYRLDYSITFWMLKRYTENWINDWLLGQFGQVGSGQNELFLPVQHTDPWKKINQSFKWEGSNDLSELEGDDQRYIRIQHNFALRMWAMLPKVDDAPPIETIRENFQQLNTSTEIGVDADDYDTDDPVHSNNLFHWAGIATDFARWTENAAGDAEVSYDVVSPTGRPASPQNPSIALALNDVDDAVPFVEWLSNRHDDGYGIVSVAFQYTSDGPVTLEIDQADDTESTKEQVGRYTLPESPDGWQRVHQFFLTSKAVFFVRVRGTDAKPASVRLYQFDVRNIYDVGKRAYTGASSGGGTIELTWQSLEKRGHLFAAVVGSAGTVTLENDPNSPDASRAESVDPANQVGFVGLMQPKDSKVEMTLTGTGSPSRVYQMPYRAYFRGNTV